MSMVSAFGIVSAAVSHSSKASWGVPYHQLTEEEKTSRAWFANDSAQYSGSTQKWTAAS